MLPWNSSCLNREKRFQTIIAAVTLTISAVLVLIESEIRVEEFFEIRDRDAKPCRFIPVLFSFYEQEL